MAWLISLPAWVHVVGWLALSLGLVVISGRVVRIIVAPDDRDHVQGIAAPLMPALGAAFAVLTALTLSSEAGYVRSAQDIVSTEAAQASRLAWASTSPGVATAPIQEALTDYLVATRAKEWHGESTAEADDPAMADVIAQLERVVRGQAARTELGTPASTELLAALDSVTTERRARIAAASREISALYVLTLVASGAALVVNAGALTIRSTGRSSLLPMGLAVVVGLSLALLFALSGPWDGGLVVSGQALDTVVRDLRGGFFHG